MSYPAASLLYPCLFHIWFTNGILTWSFSLSFVIPSLRTSPLNGRLTGNPSVLPLNIVDSWKRHQGKNQQRCGKSHGLPRKIVDKCWIFPLGTGSFPPKTPQWTTAWKRFHESRAVHGVTLSTTNSFLLRRGTWEELKAWLQIKTPWFPVDLPSGHLTSISMGHFPWLC